MTAVRMAMIVAVVCGSLCTFGCAPSNEAAFGTMETQFRQLPMEARRITGPLFWLHGDESKERLEQYVGIVAEGGNGTFTAESRPHQDWMGEGWWRDLAICLEAAKKNDLQMWIFDEKWWPSGEVGGKVPQEFSSKTMVATEQETAGPGKYEADGLGGWYFIALIAGKVTDAGIDADSLVDLGGQSKEGKVVWDVPEGKWKVMRFEWKYSRILGKGANLLVDGADQAATDWYIKTVYQPHYDRFKADFGKTIPGFFYDEPETQGDWGSAVIPMLKERGIDWKKALVAWKFKLAGEQQAAAKYQYQDAFAEAWGKTLFGGITEWCHKHKVQSIGHFLEHSWEYLNPNLCAGNMFQLLKYSDMGAIDAVFAQFVEGKRDPGLWQTPKHASSISHVYGKKDDIAMVEIFGARGQDLTYPEMKWWTDHMFVSGVNFMIPHSFNPKSPFDLDCPPYFYNGGYEPRWPLYRVYADYASRLSVMLSGGRHVCPVALLYLGNSRHVGKTVTPEQLSTALQDSLFDFDWLPYDAWETDTRIDGGSLRLQKEEYRVLVVPPVEVIPYATLEKAKAFFDAGGVVIGYGFLPTLSATLGKDSKDITAIRQAVWGAPKPGMAVCKTNAKGGRSYLLPQEPTVAQIQAAMKDAGVTATMEVLEGVTDNWLHVVHRQKAGRDIFFVCNQNITPGARTYRLRFHAAGVPEMWDPMRNEIHSIAYNRTGDAADVSITLAPYESMVFVFNPDERKLVARFDPKQTQGLKEVAVTADALPESPLAIPPQAAEGGDPLEGLKWVWMPGGNPAATAKVGTCFFRKRMELPAGTKVKSAKFIGTADNAMLLWVNGKRVDSTGQGFDNWKEISNTELTGLFLNGTNMLAISVVNGSDQPNPAGLIGKFVVELDNGSKVTAAIDASWKVSEQAAAGWQASDFDDKGWAAAGEFAAYGEGPWKTISGRSLTLSPIQRATPYAGHFVLDSSFKAGTERLMLAVEGVGPETAARVTVNGKYAGGFIERPETVDLTEYVKPGRNDIRIEPFMPKSVKVFVCP
jgi:hypothetical protein